jgi:transposase
VKTNRRDALTLARLLRAGALTAVWVPDAAHDAMRKLVRARTAAVKDVGLKKRQVSAFLLRHSRIFPRKKNWGARYRRWLATQGFEHPADQIVLQEGIEAVRVAEERRARIEQALEAFLPTWGLAPLVEALQARRGVDLVTAVTFVVEVGDIRRFENPRQLMGSLGLVPGERSTADAPCGAAPSPRWATPGCAISLLRALGPTGIRRASGRRSSPSSSACRPRCARSRGRRRAA